MHAYIPTYIMKINSHTRIIGKNVILVPYNEHHVPKYHEWMKSEELQKLTASEPLALDEEYQMQKSWRNDEDKCTFIILDRAKYEETNNEIDAMVGDTNIFLDRTENVQTGEIEIMIAEKAARGNKIGWEAVILMLLYATSYIKLTKFIAKISLENYISIKMFRKLCFEDKSVSEVFQEITIEKEISDQWLFWLNNQVQFEIKTEN